MVSQITIDKTIKIFSEMGHTKIVTGNKSYFHEYMRSLEKSGEIESWAVDSSNEDFRFSLIKKEEKLFLFKTDGTIEALN